MALGVVSLRVLGRVFGRVFGRVLGKVLSRVLSRVLGRIISFHCPRTRVLPIPGTQLWQSKINVH